MSRYKENHTIKKFLNKFYQSYIPNRNDNLKQIALKTVFIISFIAIIITVVYYTTYFANTIYQNNIFTNTRKIWHKTQNDTSPSETLLKQNSDFKGWITIDGTKIDYPIYQTNDNTFYLAKNHLKKYSTYGSLLFDCNNKISVTETDKNLVIYGNNIKSGDMFGELIKYQNIDFYKTHPTINFSTQYEKSIYKIYAVFLLNAYKSDDNNYIYNIYRDSFVNSADFTVWVDDARERSIIDTQINVQYGDEILTLVTSSDEFKDARLVVMARKTRTDENPNVNTFISKANKNPRYPKRWYDEKNLEYPY